MITQTIPANVNQHVRVPKLNWICLLSSLPSNSEDRALEMHGQIFPIPVSAVHMGKAAQMQYVSLLVNNLLSSAWVLPKQRQFFFGGGGPKRRTELCKSKQFRVGFSICFTETCQAGFW